MKDEFKLLFKFFFQSKDPPFLMLRNESGKNFTGNDRFVGYSVDLAQKISEILKFDYEFRLVKDGKFGVKGLLLSVLVSVQYWFF